MSGSLLDDEKLNEALDSTVKKVLGDMNVMLERVKQISTQCLDTTLRIDTITIDVGNLKNEKAVVHKVMRTIEPSEESPSKNKRDILDLYIEKMKTINTSTRHRYVHQIALSSNYTQKMGLHIDPEIEPCSSQISTKTDQVFEKNDLIVKNEETNDSKTSINGHHESESNNIPETKKQQLFAPPKKPIFDSESEEEENGLNDDTVAKAVVSEMAAESKPEVKQNGMLDIQKELAAKFASSKTPQVTQNSHSENGPKTDSPTEQQMPVSSLAPTPLANSVIQPEPEPKSMNTSEAMSTPVLEIKTNGTSDFKKELAAKLATPKIPPPPTTKTLFSDSESEEPLQKSIQKIEPAQKSEIKTNGAAKPDNHKPSAEKDIQTSIDNKKKTSLNNREVVTKPIQKKFSLLDDSDSDEDLFNKSAIVRKPTNVEVKKPLNIGSTPASSSNKPMKSLLDSDSEEDPNSLFQATKVIKTPAKSILESDDDMLFEKKPVLSKPVDKKTPVIIEDQKKTDSEKPSASKKTNNRKAAEPKKIASKSIFFESDDSDDELFKSKTKKVISEKPTTSSFPKISGASHSSLNSKNPQDFPNSATINTECSQTPEELQIDGESKDILSSPISKPSTVEDLPILKTSPTSGNSGKIETSDFKSNLNALLAKKPGSVPKIESSPTTPETSQDSFNSILKSKPKGPNRRPRNASTQNKSQEQHQNQSLAKSSEIPTEEPFFDPLS